MSVMDLVKKIAGKKSEKSEKFKQMQEDDRLYNMLEERKKSSNRRELEAYYKEKEEERIKKELDVIRKKRNKEAWKGSSVFGQKATILKGQKSIMKDDRPILKEKNIFAGNKSKSMRSMYFK